MRPRVYISGPMTGDGTPEAMAQNVAEGVRVAKLLIRAGFSVFCPHLSGLMPGHEEIPHEVWIDNDLPWVQVADAVLRLPGESQGADAEVDYAVDCDVRVFTSVERLLEEFKYFLEPMT